MHWRPRLRGSPQQHAGKFMIRRVCGPLLGTGRSSAVAKTKTLQMLLFE
jgi:hypothetical protein